METIRLGAREHNGEPGSAEQNRGFHGKSTIQFTMGLNDASLSRGSHLPEQARQFVRHREYGRDRPDPEFRRVRLPAGVAIP
jgi:hypothetical protein